MDGNGRWAQRRGLSRIEGHRRGKDSVRAVVEASAPARHSLPQPVRVLDGELAAAATREVNALMACCGATCAPK